MKKSTILLILGIVVLGLIVAPTVSAATYKTSYKHPNTPAKVTQTIKYAKTYSQLTITYTNNGVKRKEMVTSKPSAYKTSYKQYKNGKLYYSSSLAKGYKISKKVYKKSGSYTIIIVTVKKNGGRIAKGKWVNLFYKGKSYYKKTNSKGQVFYKFKGKTATFKKYAYIYMV